MKLKNSEVLLLTQVLYHIKCADSYFFEFSDQIHELHQKLCSYLLKDENNDTDSQSSEEDVDCVLHHNEDLFEIVESTGDSQDPVAIKDLLLLDSVRVSHEDKKRKFLFETGTSKSMLDINLDDGEEILCDVTNIKRHADSFVVNCVSGWVTFEVQKFPKSWTSLLKRGIVYKVV